MDVSSIGGTLSLGLRSHSQTLHCPLFQQACYHPLHKHKLFIQIHKGKRRFCISRQGRNMDGEGEEGVGVEGEENKRRIGVSFTPL